MAIRIIRQLLRLTDVEADSIADGETLIWDDATSKFIPGAGGGGGGAPDDATYLVTASDAGLENEVVVGATPGGELGGTWASPTVDATHSGSTHAAVQAAAEATAAAALLAHTTDATDAHPGSAITNTAAGNIAATTVQAAINELDTDKAATVHAHAGEDITSGTVADARIASTIARDSEVTSAISTSESGQVRDGDAAGGVLGGTYPNPSFAADMATQAELDAHVSDSSAAHAASAVSADSTTLVGTGTDVQAVLEELDNAIVAIGSVPKRYFNKPAGNITRAATSVGAFSTAWQITNVVVASGQNVSLRMSASAYGSADTQDILFAFFRDSAQIASTIFTSDTGAGVEFCRSFDWIDENPGAATYTYEIRAAMFGAGTLTVYQSNITTDTLGGGSVFIAEVYTP